MILLLAVIWPLGAFVLSITNYNHRDFRIGVYAIAVMFALCAQIVATDTFTADITRNLEHAVAYKDLPWLFLLLEKDFFLGVSGKLLCYISDDLRFLYVCYILIKTTLFLKCVGIVVNNIPPTIKKIHLLPLLSMIFVTTFYEVNSTRFTIASIFFVWCTLEILINHNKRFYGFIFLSPLIHFSFWLVMPLPFLYKVLKNKTKLVWLIFAFSFIFSLASTSLLMNKFAEKNMSESVSRGVGVYASEEGLENMEERYAEGARSGNLNRAISRSIVDVRNYGVMICVAFFSIYCYRRNNKDGIVAQLMNYLLLLYSFANIANSNSQGVRFYLVTAELAVFFLVMMMYRSEGMYTVFFNDNKKWFNSVYYLTTIAGFLYLFIGRSTLNLFGVLFGNYFIHF